MPNAASRLRNPPIMQAKPDISVLEDVYRGAAALVMAGGPSLLDDLDAAARLSPRPEVFLSCNWRPAQVVACDYILWMDEAFHDFDGARVRNWDRIGRLPGVKVSRFQQHSDYLLGDRPPPAANTALLSAWFADFLGCATIWLGGMDGYRSPQSYFDAPPDKRLGGQNTGQERVWANFYRAALPGADIRAVSGPLQAIFPADPSERSLT